MKDKCIITLIEEKRFAGLSDDELVVIRVHIAECVNCHDAFQAAQMAAELLRERTAAEFEPSPFFTTRVMANWRERQATNDMWAWSKLWRSAGALASSMLAAVAMLAVLTFVIPGSEVGSPVSSAGVYSAEEVLLGQSLAEEDSDVQLLSTIYDE